MAADRREVVFFQLRGYADTFVAEGTHADTAQVSVKEDDRGVDDGAVAQLFDDLLVGAWIGACVLDHHNVLGSGDLFQHWVTGDGQSDGRLIGQDGVRGGAVGGQEHAIGEIIRKEINPYRLIACCSGYLPSCCSKDVIIILRRLKGFGQAQQRLTVTIEFLKRGILSAAIVFIFCHGRQTPYGRSVWF